MLRLLARMLALSALLPACSAGGLGDGVRPDKPQVAGGLCSEVSPFGQPLVVDWRPDERARLEVAMKQHIAVVKYDCDHYELLDCQVPGSYSFMGTSLKQETLRLENRDELGANLPAFGAQLSAKVERDQSLDLVTMTVGMRRTTKPVVHSKELEGECEGATHFVRGAFVGAFALGTRTAGETRAGVELFNVAATGASSSKQQTTSHDGDPQACQSAIPASTDSPPKCSALLRLELTELGAEPAKAAGAVDVCPQPSVLSGGKCTAESGEPFQCREGRKDECEAQCRAGHDGSCAALGFMLFGNHGVTKDLKRAVQLSDQACQAGNARACSNLGTVFYEGKLTGKDYGRAQKLFQQACTGGFATGCHNLAQVKQHGADAGEVIELFDRACRGGVGAACHNLAIELERRGRSQEDSKAAARAYGRACEAGFDDACANLAVYQLRGVGVAKDPAAAKASLDSLCNRDVHVACANLAKVLLGDAQPNVEQAARLAQRACEGSAASGCTTLAGIRLLGLSGSERNPALAAERLEHGCGLADDASCTALGVMKLDGVGRAADPVVAAAKLDQACKRGHGYACELLGVIYSEGPAPLTADHDRADKYMQRACRLGAGVSCDHTLLPENEPPPKPARPAPEEPQPKPPPPKQDDGLVLTGASSGTIRASVARPSASEQFDEPMWNLRRAVAGCLRKGRGMARGTAKIDIVLAYTGRLTRLKIKESTFEDSVTECFRHALQTGDFGRTKDGRSRKDTFTIAVLDNPPKPKGPGRRKGKVIVLDEIVIAYPRTAPPGCTCERGEVRALCALYCSSAP